jgi:hypothetical protein
VVPVLRHPWKWSSVHLIQASLYCDNEVHVLVHSIRTRCPYGWFVLVHAEHLMSKNENDTSFSTVQI